MRLILGHTKTFIMILSYLNFTKVLITFLMFKSISSSFFKKKNQLKCYGKIFKFKGLLRLNLCADNKKTFDRQFRRLDFFRKLFQAVETSNVSLLKYLYVFSLVERVPTTPRFGLARRRCEEGKERGMDDGN